MMLAGNATQSEEDTNGNSSLNLNTINSSVVAHQQQQIHQLHNNNGSFVYEYSYKIQDKDSLQWR